MKPLSACRLVALPIVTAEGTFIARYSDAGLGELSFPAGRPVGSASRGGRPEASSSRNARPERIPAPVRAWHRLTGAAVKNILAGRPVKKLPPLDLRGTAFQQSVWRELRRIGSGRTRSYGELARRVGRPRAGRAVGGACGANPVPLLVPCHRVLAAHGRLGGFSGGLAWKRRLLQREGISF